MSGRRRKWTTLLLACATAMSVVAAAAVGYQVGRWDEEHYWVFEKDYAQWCELFGGQAASDLEGRTYGR